jgi:fructose-1,6-bisphosphatase/sedoheptulose 1,7-bisphosphatase-like protein
VKKTYTAEELAPGKNIIFAATGVTEGSLLQGVRFFGEGVRTSSIVMKMASRKIRFVEGIHLEPGKEFAVRF